jgi:hypothetical protein
MDTEPTEHIGSSPKADSLLDMDTSQLREQIVQLKSDAAEAIASGRKRTGEPKVERKPNDGEDKRISYPLSWDGHLRVQLDRAIWPRGSDQLEKARHIAATDFLRDVAPRSPLEQIIAAQILACHSAAMECFDHALGMQGSCKLQYLSLAGKLSRTIAQLIDTIDRHRNGKSVRESGEKSED